MDASLRRLAGLLAACVLLVGTNPALAFEVRTTASGSIVRPDHHGYTSYWDWGPGAGVGAEVIPDGSDFGIALWTEYAELPGRTRGFYGDTIVVAPWRQTKVFAGLRAHLHPIREAPGLSVTADLAIGRGLLDFGEVQMQSQRVLPNVIPRNRQYADISTFGAGLEFVGERFGVFADVRSEIYSETTIYTWNTKRIGLIWRPWRSQEESSP